MCEKVDLILPGVNPSEKVKPTEVEPVITPNSIVKYIENCGGVETLIIAAFDDDPSLNRESKISQLTAKVLAKEIQPTEIEYCIFPLGDKLYRTMEGHGENEKIEIIFGASTLFCNILRNFNP